MLPRMGVIFLLFLLLCACFMGVLSGNASLAAVCVFTGVAALGLIGLSLIIGVANNVIGRR